jgi:hypothetical protein
MAQDDRYENKFAPLDSTAIYPKPGHVLLYTPLTGEMKCLTSLPLSCAFHFISTNLHYYTNLNRGGQKGLTEVVFATASVERSRLIVALTEAVALPASVNQKKTKKEKSMDRPDKPIHAPLPLPS